MSLTMIPGKTSPQHAAHEPRIREASRLAKPLLRPPQIQHARVIMHARREAGRTPKYNIVGTHQKTCICTLARNGNRTRYSEPKDKDRPIHDGVDESRQVGFEFLLQSGKRAVEATDNPGRYRVENPGGEQGSDLFLIGPIERVIGIIRWLRNEDDIGVFFTLEAVRG